MAFDENLFIERGKIVHRFGECAAHLRQCSDRWSYRFERFDTIGFFGETRKRKRLEIARETNTARHHDAIVRAGALAGDRRGTDKIVDVHHGN
jgi:hypothetical protein